MIWSGVAFALLAALLLVSAYKVVATEYVTHAALYLALTLFSVAGLFVLLDAPFLAAIRVLVYVGAVIAVFVFAVMLSELQEIGAGATRFRGLIGELQAALRSPYWGALPFAVALLVSLLVVVGIGALSTPASPAAADTSVSGIGRALFTTYLVPFEIAGIVLLVAMVGAIVMAREGSQS